MSAKLKNFVSLVLMIAILMLIAVVISEYTGLRARWEAQRIQAEADKLGAQADVLEQKAVMQRQQPLVIASLVDTAMATLYAASDRLLLVLLIVWILFTGEVKKDENPQE